MREIHSYTSSLRSVLMVHLGGSSFKSMGDNIFYKLLGLSFSPCLDMIKVRVAVCFQRTRECDEDCAWKERISVMLR